MPFISGTLAYVADDTSGLAIIDVSNPGLPILVGTYNTSGNAVGASVSGTLACVADSGSGLQIIDVSVPSTPRLVGGYNTKGTACDVTVSGTLVFVADYGTGLQLVGVPPDFVGITQTDTTTWRINLSCALAQGTWNVSIGPHVTDLAGNTMDQDADGTGGEAPDDVYTLSFTVDTTRPSIPANLSLADDTGSAADAVTTDTTPTFTWSESSDNAGVAGYEWRLEGGDWTATTERTTDLAVAEGQWGFEVRAVDIAGNRGLAAVLPLAIDLTPPEAPGGLRLDGSVLLWDEPVDVGGIWKYECRIDGGEWMETAVRQAQTGLREGQSAFVEVRAIDRAGNAGSVAAAALTADYGPRVLDHGPRSLVGPVDFITITLNEPIEPATLTAAEVCISGTSLPALVGTYDTGGSAWSVTVSGTLTYVADFERGLAIIDVSDPCAPTLLGTYNTTGYARDVTVSGTLAYVADGGSGLAIIDVSNPSAPSLRGTYDTSGYVRGVTVSGTLAYVADHDQGLQIIDVSNPSAPTLRGVYNTSGYAYNVTVSGTLAYVADHDQGLQIIDVSDPSAPTLRGVYNTSGYAYNVTVSGTLAYVADGGSGLAIIDVSNPSAPSLRGAYNTSGNALGVTVSGTLAYVADEGGGLAIIDVSDPASPVLAGSYDTSGSAYGVAVSGTLAFVADWDCGLQILRVLQEVVGVTQTDPTTWQINLSSALTQGTWHVSIGPHVTDLTGNTMDQDADGAGGETPDDVYTFSFMVDATPPSVPGDLAFANDTGSTGDAVTSDTSLSFGWSASSDLSGIAGYEYRVNDGDWIWTTERTADLTLAEGQRIFEVRAVDTFGNKGLPAELTVAVDLTPPEAPGGVRLDGSALLWQEPADAGGIWKYEYRVDGGGWTETVATQAQTELAEGQSGLFEVRATDRAGNTGFAASAMLTADYGPRVVGHSPQGVIGPVDYFTITFNEPIDPATMTTVEIRVIGSFVPTLVGAFDTSGSAQGVSVSGTLAYVADGYSGLQIIDISNPSAPTLRGAYNTNGYAYDVAVSGTLAYMGLRSGLAIIDVSNPAAPTLRGAYNTSGHAIDVSVSGTLAYVADYDKGLQIIDVSNPSLPTLVGAYNTSGYARDVTVSGTLAYVADGYSGLQIIDVSNPATPVLRGTYNTGGSAEGVTVSGTLAYVADGERGLAIIDASNPAAPVLRSTYDTSGISCSVTVSGGLVYVADYSGGVAIVDVSDPSSPVLRGTYDTTGYAYGVALSGTLAYVADDISGLQILKAFPKVVGITETDQTTWRINLSSTLTQGTWSAFLAPGATDLSGNTMDQDADGAGGRTPDDVYAFSFHVDDATPPPVPGNLTFAEDTGSTGDTVTSDTSLTFAWSESDDPWEIAGYEWRVDNGAWVATTERTAELMLAEGQREFEVRAVDTLGHRSLPAALVVTVDLTAPEAPTGLQLDGSVLLWQEPADAGGIWKYEYRIDGNTWIDTTATQAQTGLAEGHSALVEVRAIDRAGNTGPVAAATLTADYGPRVVSHSPEGLSGAVDFVTLTFNEPINPATLTGADVSVSGPSLPALVGAYDTSGYAVNVTVSGTLAYLADGDRGLAIINVSNPTSPVRVSTFDTSGSALGVAVSDTLAYVADGDSGLQILDVSNPAAPVLLGVYNTSGKAHSVTVCGSLAYVADYTSGLAIIDVSSPSAPVLVGTYDTSGSAYDVTVSGALAYVTDGNNGLAIIDVSDPAAPAIRGTFDTNGSALRMTLSGTLVYVADHTSGLEIIDVSDPAAPVLRGAYDTSGYALDVTISGTLAYVADGYSGLAIIDVSSPATPVLRGTYDTNGAAYGVTVSGTLAFVADYGSGLQILRVPPGIVGITQTDPTTWRINLSTALTESTWSVSIGPHVTDLSGNTMDQDADGAGGEASDDVYTFSFTVDETPPIPGDANRSGTVDAADAQVLAAHWGMSGMTWAEGDFNDDGRVNAADAAILAANWGRRTSPLIPGDANDDGRVNQADAVILADHWGRSGMSWADGDFNKDGRVNAADAAILAANWGNGASEAVKPQTPLAPVEPVPAPMADSPLVGPVPMDRRDAARRRVEPAARAEAAEDLLLVPPRLDLTAQDAAAAADAALVEEFGPMAVEQAVEQPIAQSDLACLTFARAPWTQTLARRHRPSDSATYFMTKVIAAELGR